MMGLTERRAPTHILRIEVPLNLNDPPYDYDPVADALKLALAISRAGFAGHICDDPAVTMEESGNASDEWNAGVVEAARAVADMLDSKPLGLDEGDLALVARLRRALGDE